MFLVKRQAVSRNKDFPVGLLLFLIVSLFFMVRFVKVFLANDVGGSHAYAQIINAGMPMLKATYYEKDAYEEFVNIESIIKETLWLDKINPTTILAAEIPGFETFNQLVLNDEAGDLNNEGTTNPVEDVDSFVLGDDSITKPEAISVDPAGIRNPDIVKTLDQSNPEVLMYHTHNTEAYSVDRNFTEDLDKNIMGIGDLVVKELEEYYGIAVVHDKTKHDTMYTDSYYRSRETIQKYSEQYPNGFDLVIDLHRDGVGKTNKKPVLRNINGEDVAAIYFVDTRNSSNFENTHDITTRMDAKANELFPTFSRGIRTANQGKSKYNQDIMKNTILLEVGAESNTPEEAKASAKYIARLIAEEVYYRNNN